MKNALKKISDVLKMIFGYGIMISLFLGGITFFGYVAAIIIGGDTAAAICEFMYKTLIPIAIYISTIMVLLGLLSMYLAGEYALTTKKKDPKNGGEKECKSTNA